MASRQNTRAKPNKGLELTAYSRSSGLALGHLPVKTRETLEKNKRGGW
jgi:hypothetical protein